MRDRQPALRSDDADPVVAPVTSVDDIAVGTWHACALQGGEADCWPLGSASKLDVSGLTDGEALGRSRDTFCARRTGGAVSCWDPGDAASEVAGLDAVTLGPDGRFDTLCALEGDALECWGDTTASHTLPVSSPQAYDVGMDHCVVESDGDLGCWSAYDPSDYAAVPGMTGVVSTGATAYGFCESVASTSQKKHRQGRAARRPGSRRFRRLRALRARRQRRAGTSGKGTRPRPRTPPRRGREGPGAAHWPYSSRRRTQLMVNGRSCSSRPRGARSRSW